MRRRHVLRWIGLAAMLVSALLQLSATLIIGEIATTVQGAVNQSVLLSLLQLEATIGVPLGAALFAVSFVVPSPRTSADHDHAATLISNGETSNHHERPGD